MTLDSLEEGPIETEPEENKLGSFDEGVGVQIENVIPAAAPMPEAPKIGKVLIWFGWVDTFQRKKSGYPSKDFAWSSRSQTEAPSPRHLERASDYSRLNFGYVREESFG